MFIFHFQPNVSVIVDLNDLAKARDLAKSLRRGRITSVTEDTIGARFLRHWYRIPKGGACVRDDRKRVKEAVARGKRVRMG